MIVNSNEYKIGMKEQVANLFKRFSSTYQNLWVTGNPRETAELMAFWISELHRKNITPEMIAAYGAQITDATEFRNFPPKPVQFAQFLSEEERRANNNDKSNDIETVVNKLCKKWKMIYGHLFCSKDEMSDIVDFWSKEIIANKLSSGSVKKAYFEIRKQAKFRTYPPSLDAFILTAKLCELGVETNNIPSSDEAYLIACNKKDPHPLIREARRRVGSYEVRTQSSEKIRKAFERAYDAVVMEFSSGDLKLETKCLNESIVESCSGKNQRSETLGSTIEDILEKLKANEHS